MGLTPVQVHQVETKHLDRCQRSRQAIDKTSSEERDKQSDSRNDRTSVGPLGRDKAEDPCTKGRKHTKRHGQKTRLKGIKTKILDNDRTKCKKTTVRDIDSDVVEEHQPDLDIEDGLERLTPLP